MKNKEPKQRANHYNTNNEQKQNEIRKHQTKNLEQRTTNTATNKNSQQMATHKHQ